MDNIFMQPAVFEEEYNAQGGAPNQNFAEKKRKGISGSTLKLIAIIVMFIDHIGAVIVERMLMNVGMQDAMLGDMNTVMGFTMEYMPLMFLDFALRMIGRLGFPIFCFLLIEGFKHTKNVWKYAARLGAFAIISEVPFDLAFKGSLFDMSYQNVFFTLFIGLMVMIVFDIIENNNLNKVIKVILYIVSIGIGMVVATLLKTDYAAIGVVCIMVLYIFRKKKMAQIISGCVVFVWEVTAPLAFLPIAFYNGKRGWNMKYIFYAFYPIHLLVLYGIAVYFGIA